MSRHRGWVIAVAALTLLFGSAASAYPGQEGVNQGWGRDRTRTLYRRASLIRARRAQFEALVNGAARTHRARAELLHAIIEVESAYDAAAVSPGGAVGLMQFRPTTAAPRTASPTRPIPARTSPPAPLDDHSRRPPGGWAPRRNHFLKPLVGRVPPGSAGTNGSAAAHAPSRRAGAYSVAAWTCADRIPASAALRAALVERFRDSA